MPAERIFLDSNVMIYAYFKQNEKKQRISKQLISQNAIISTQVLQELTKLYSEDMQHNQHIENLTIKNPFA